MKKIVKVKYNKNTKEHYLDLKDFKGFFDIKKVISYTLEPVFDDEIESLILKFYDADGKEIPANQNKK